MGSNFGPTQENGYVRLVGSGVPDAYIINVSSWSNSDIKFVIPEYAAVGNYHVLVQTVYGASAELALMSAAHQPPALTIAPIIKGWVDLHTHPMSYLGFGGKLIYGAVDVDSILPPESPPPGGSCGSGSVASTEQQALGQENLVHGGAGLSNLCGDDIRYQVIQQLESTTPNSAVYSDSTYTSSGYQGPNPNPADFSTWPAWNDLVDQRMWVNWIQRSFAGGQRVLVALAVNNKLLADMTRGPGDLPDDDLGSGDLQIAQMKAFVARHSSFMQIASSSSDVQSIVSQGKLAIILGVELDNIGDLTGNQSNTAVVAAVDHLFDEGVRYIFPIHLVNNPLGGTAVYNYLFDYANEWEEGAPYALGCSQLSDDIGMVLNTDVSNLVKVAQEAKLHTTLAVPPSLACKNTPNTGNVNLEGLTSAGTAAIEEMMRLHMLIDIDHMSQLSANQTIALAQQHAGYPYPLFSGHNGVRTFSAGINAGSSERSLTAAQYQALGKLHGMAGVGSAQLTADKWMTMYNQVIGAMGPGVVAGFGTDMDGMEFGMPPRCVTTFDGMCMGSLSKVVYREGINSECPAAPLMLASTEGNRTWNYNTVGVAHYGMLPDFLQDVSTMSGGCTLVTNMMNGAQYFYETWRIAEGNTSAIAPPTPPLPRPSTPSACPGIQVANTPGQSPACVCPAHTKLNSSGVCACVNDGTLRCANPF
jgi:microsomal dipeptidase-like Zn-dependent dipeptidase